MSQLKEKELQLLAAMVKNFKGSIYPYINWDQAALDSGYQDAKNAKTMWSRLAKKFDAAAATASAPHATAGDNDNDTGEGSSTTPKVAMVKKRKAAAFPEADNSSAKVAQNGRPTKKAKSARANVKTEDHLSEAEPSIEQQDEEEAV